ncbi:MAG: hypothetical protein Q9181_006815 [Wetmoreana brouardii]
MSLAAACHPQQGKLKGQDRRPNGLDDPPLSTPSTKKRKREVQGAGTPEDLAQEKGNTVPRILPGERTGDYAARVDQALPLMKTGKATKMKGLEGLKVRQTRTEKRMQKMQAEWRQADLKLKEKLEELRDEEEDNDPNPTITKSGGSKSERKNHRKRQTRNTAARNQQLGGQEDDDNDDP